MPQLAIETFVSQYFWLVLILGTFYWISVTQIIPSISETLKTRRKIESLAVESSEDGVEEDVNAIKSSNVISEVFASSRKNTAASTSDKNFTSHFVESNNKWLNSI